MERGYKMTELKMADIYSSYLDEINALRKENKRLKKQLDKKEKDLMATVGTLVEIAKAMGWEK